MTDNRNSGQPHFSADDYRLFVDKMMPTKRQNKAIPGQPIHVKLPVIMQPLPSGIRS